MSVFQEIDDEDTAERIESMLPDFAVAKVQHLEEISQGRSAVVSNLVAQSDAERDKRSNWTLEIGRTEMALEREGVARTKEIDDRLALLNRRIAKSYEETKRLEAAKQLEPTLPPYLLYEALQELAPDSVLKDARASVKLGKSEDVTDKINASRNKISALTKQRGAVRNALLPKEAAIHRAVTDIKQSAAQCAPDFTPNARLVRPTINMRPRQGKTAWPKLSLETGSRLIEVEDAASIVKFVMRDALIATATESISKLYEGNPLVVPEGERESRIAGIDAEILAEARIEEAFIELAEAKGIKILRRPNAPPFAVLGVAVASTDDADDFG